MPTPPNPQRGAGDLLALLRDGTPRTNAELIRLTGLARGTLSTRLEQLKELGLIQPYTPGASTGGRPPSQVVFNDRAAHIAGVELGATHGTVSLTTLSHQEIASHSSRLSIADGPEAILDWVTNTIKTLQRKHLLDPFALAGIGIGVPGPVEHSSGRPVSPPIMPGWDNMPIPDYLRRSFPVPILVDNDVNLLALGAHATRWPDARNFLYVKVATGIGAGLILNGQLHRGEQGCAGDLGYLALPGATRDGFATLEEVAGGAAIASRLRAQGVDVADASGVATLVREHHPAALEATRQAGRELGTAIALMVTLLNPSVIALGGALAHAGEQLLAGVREVAYGRSTPLATRNLSIVQAERGVLAGSIGAALMVSGRVLSAEAIDARVNELG